MALGARTIVESWIDGGGLHHLILSFPLSTGANWTAAGETIDLSTAGTFTGGTSAAYDGFKTAVHGGVFLGWQGANNANARRVVQYDRAAAGAPATGTIRVTEDNGVAGQLRNLPDLTDVSGVTVLMKFVGR